MFKPKRFIRTVPSSSTRGGVQTAKRYTIQAETTMPRLYKEGLRPDVIVVDPPRAGCAEPLLEAIANMQPQCLIYVSCNPTTLARDLANLSQNGFGVQEVQPVDMFPHTGYVESIARLNYELNKTSLRELMDTIIAAKLKLMVVEEVMLWKSIMIY